MLDKDDIKAIRQANYVVLFYSPDKYQHPDADWGMRVGKRIKTDVLWSDGKDYHFEDTVTRTIVADPKNCLLHSHRRPDSEVKSCIGSVEIYSFEAYPSCALKQLRAGDELGLKFVGSNDSDNLRAAGLHHDSAWFRIVRNGKVVAEYQLDDRICANNSARIMHYADSY